MPGEEAEGDGFLGVMHAGRGSCFGSRQPRMNEESAMPSGLYGEEDAIEDDGEDRERERLHRRQRPVWSRCCEVRQNESDHRQGYDDREISCRALQVV